jgi:predicted nucleic acid-binding protein
LTDPLLRMVCVNLSPAFTLHVVEPSGTRLADLLIASTAATNGLPLYTRNPADFSGLEQIVTVIAV